MPAMRLFRVALAATLLTALPSTAAAETPLTPDPAWVADGGVQALARVGQTLYLAGSFTRLSPPTGSGVTVDAAGAVVPGPEFDARVEATLGDGAGGLYVAGSFEHVDGAPATIAHLLADGSVDPAFAGPAIKGSVRALAVSGGKLYAGGHIDSVNGTAGVRHMLRVDKSTGTLDTGFKPFVTGYSEGISALAASGSTLYVGGSFTQF